MLTNKDNEILELKRNVALMGEALLEVMTDGPENFQALARTALRAAGLVGADGLPGSVRDRPGDGEVICPAVERRNAGVARAIANAAAVGSTG